jgi:dTDP-glucose 4,6-dehydratase
MTKYLILGGSGFIGSHYIKLLLKKHKDIQVINLDKMTYCGNEDNLLEVKDDIRYSFIKGNICDEFTIKSILEMERPDYIVNFAAETHVDNSIDNALYFMTTNFYGVYNILNEILKIKNKDTASFGKNGWCPKKIVQVSTDEVYGSVDKPSKETTAFNPSSPYSASKAGGDLLALSYYKTFGLPVVVTRSSNNYGPNQYPEKVIPLFITNLLQNKKVPLYGKGLNKRDWLYVEDNCSAIELVMREGKNGEAYNIAANYEINNKTLTETILDILHKNSSSIKYVTDRLGHDLRYSMNISKIKRLGWKPKTNFIEGINKTVYWYIDNKWWWKKLI